MQVNPGTWYVVTTDSECTVTDANGKTLCTAVAGEQKPFLATTMEVTLSDEGATVTRTTFKHAALALGLFGGGVTSSLPAGFTRLAFLESTGSQAIRVPAIIDTAVAVVSCTFSLERIYSTQHPWGINSLIGEGDYRTGLRIIEGNQSTGEYILRFMEPKTSWTQHAVYSAKLGEKIDVVVDYSQGKLYCGGELKFEFSKTALVFSGYCGVFGHYYNTNGSFTDRLRGRISHFSISANGKPQCDIVPALDSSGTPCMFDTVSKQTFYNSRSGAFIAGFTLAQARKLGNLPANTTLTISLPVGYDSDEGVVNALAQAGDNGCVLTIQTYEVASAATTFALRRIWVKRTQDDNGSYVDSNNTRWNIDWCVDIIGADPETLGYERFRSVEVAAEYWELTLVMTIEEDLTETE